MIKVSIVFRKTSIRILWQNIGFLKIIMLRAEIGKRTAERQNFDMAIKYSKCIYVYFADLMLTVSGRWPGY